MAVWAYRCQAPNEGGAEWFVSALKVAELGPDVQIVRVQVGRQWRCAVLDRSQRLTVQDQLVRPVIASDSSDCPECAEWLAREAAAAGEPQAESSSPQHQHREGVMKILAAAISLRGINFVVVVAPMSLVSSPGEADMAIEDLQPYFGGVPVVLMAQNDEGLPSYYGDSQLVDMLAAIPIDKMPWQEYPVG